jgi:hypothetical protein
VKDFFDKKWLFVGNATKGLFNFVLKTTLAGLEGVFKSPRCQIYHGNVNKSSVGTR